VRCSGLRAEEVAVEDVGAGLDVTVGTREAELPEEQQKVSELPVDAADDLTRRRATHHDRLGPDDLLGCRRHRREHEWQIL